MLVVPLQTLHTVLYTGLYNGVYAVGHYQYSLKVTINLLNSYLRESYEVMVIVDSVSSRNQPHSSFVSPLKKSLRDILISIQNLRRCFLVRKTAIMLKTNCIRISTDL